jgi:hypothetical protein
MGWNLNALMDIMFANIYEFHELSMNGWNLNALMDIIFSLNFIIQITWDIHDFEWVGW